MIQHILYNVGGTITVEGVTTLPSAANAKLVTGDGDTIFENRAATVSTIDTTLNGAVSRGDTTVTLAATTGVSKDKRMVLGDPDENVEVRSLSGSVATLWAPLMYDHPTGSTVKGTAVTVSANSDDASTLFWDGTLTINTDADDYYTQSVICTKYVLRRMATEADLIRYEPKIAQLLANEESASGLLDEAFELVVDRLASATAGRAHTYTGSDQFVIPTCYAALMLFYMRRPGDENRAQYMTYRDALAECMGQKTEGYAVRDADQDSVIESHEQESTMSGRLYRS